MLLSDSLTCHVATGRQKRSAAIVVVRHRGATWGGSPATRTAQAESSAAFTCKDHLIHLFCNMSLDSQTRSTAADKQEGRWALHY